jgi:ELWxxDGT repeat protein
VLDMQYSESRGPYRLIRKLGAGGMGTVYEAQEERLGRRVAVKFIHPHLLERADLRARFDWEARTAARVEHPNVVRVYRVDAWEGQPVIEMQYVVGTSLRDILRSGPLTPEQSAQLLAQLLEALAACHAQHIVHCDLKPGNLIISAEEHLWLTDFGVAQALHPVAETTGETAASKHTAIGGTTWYMPPEAFQGAAPSPAWDLYAAGMVAYEMIAGRPPFTTSDPAEWVKIIATQDAPALATYVPRISRELSALIAALVARDPAGRPADTAAALAWLRATPEFLARPEATLPPDAALPILPTPAALPSVQQRSPRHALGKLGVAVGVIAFAALALGLMFLSRHKLAPEAPTESASIAPSAVARKEITDLTFTQLRTYLAFDDGIHGKELWVKSADDVAPKLLADLAPGPISSAPRRFTLSSRGELYFAATTPEQGEELWKVTDNGGENPVVHCVRDILPGPMGSEPEVIATWENMVLFYATTTNQGRELWCSNGHANQTAIVADACPGREGSYPMRPYTTKTETLVYLTGFGAPPHGLMLWRYDFETNSLSEVADVPDSTTALVVYQSRLFFTREDTETGAELWVHDPKIGGASLFADLSPGPSSSSPQQFYVWQGRLFFQARTDTHGVELWTSDGTPAGTVLFADINPGPADSDPYGFVETEETLFFRAHDAAHGNEPWLTGPVPGSTRLLADVRQGPTGSTPYDYTVISGMLTFTADDGLHGEERFVARHEDGEWKTSLIADALPGPAGAEPHDTHTVNESHQLSVGRGPGNEDVLLWTTLGPDNSMRSVSPSRTLNPAR